jgi:hypothetical protein
MNRVCGNNLGIVTEIGMCIIWRAGTDENFTVS